MIDDDEINLTLKLPLITLATMLGTNLTCHICWQSRARSEQRRNAAQMEKEINKRCLTKHLTSTRHVN